MKSFQVIVLGIFGFFILAGVILFATFRGGGGTGDVGPAEALIWGTLPQETVRKVINDFALENPDTLNVTYEEIPEDSFDAELVEALASGGGPDVVIMPQELLLRHRNKIQPIPFESYTERNFRDRFINGADIFLEPGGIVALPFSVDPMVLYYNRTLFSNAGIPQVPRFWDELQSIVPRLAVVDESLSVNRAAIPFGEFRNITHAKDIIAMLIMQAGSPIVTRNQSGDLDSVLSSRMGRSTIPGESALRFYTEFSNPSKELYTWNRALPNSTDAFVSGDVALYPGYASELSRLRGRNPNLNFDVIQMPQVRDGDKLTFGRMYGLAIMKNSNRISDAFRVAGTLSSAGVISLWSDASNLPPIRRDLLVQTPTDAFGPVFYSSAIITEAFLDPDPEGTQDIFAQMISDITSGRSLVGEALRDGDSQMRRLLE